MKNMSISGYFFFIFLEHFSRIKSNTLQTASKWRLLTPSTKIIPLVHTLPVSSMKKNFFLLLILFFSYSVLSKIQIFEANIHENKTVELVHGLFELNGKGSSFTLRTSIFISQNITIQNMTLSGSNKNETKMIPT
jgi:hypothetical protein